MSSSESVKILKNDRITIRINRMVKQALIELAEEEEVSVGEMVNQWIIEGLVGESGGNIYYRVSFILQSK